MKRRAAIASLTAFFTSAALAGDHDAKDVIGVIKSDAGTIELLSNSCAESDALIAALTEGISTEKAQWLRQQPGRVLFIAASKDRPALLVCYEKTAGGIRAYGPASPERIEYADSGIQWLRRPAQLSEYAQTIVEPPRRGVPAPPIAPPSIHEASNATDDTYRYGIVEATCSNMARFLASSPEPGNSTRRVFATWLAQQPGNFVFVDRLSDGTDTGERGCFVRTDFGYRITIHGRNKPVEYHRSR